MYAPRIFRAGVDEKVLLSTSNIDFDVTFTTTFRSGRNFKVSSSNVVKPGKLSIRQCLFLSLLLINLYFLLRKKSFFLVFLRKIKCMSLFHVNDQCSLLTLIHKAWSNTDN